MQATVTKDGETIKAAICGRLDTVTSAELNEQLKSAGIDNCDIDLDFAGVEYISSAGLRLLVASRKQADTTGNSMTVRNINRVVREVFRVAGFEKVFTVV